MPRNRRHYHLTYEDCLEAHRKALLEFGGRDGILSEGLIRSAVERPYTRRYPRIYQKAAALVQSLVKNHGFVDGNKRTAVYMLHVLLTKSGYQIRDAINRHQEIETLILGVADSSIDYDALLGWFKDNIVPR